MLQLLRRRERGHDAAGRVQGMETMRCMLALGVSVTRDIAPLHDHAVTSLAVDATEHRYLLSAGNDRKIVRAFCTREAWRP